MDIKQLKALVTVVETGSVTRAAELLHLVQPAVTRQVRSLERELGVPLFERTRHGMRPTAAGLSLADRARPNSWRRPWCPRSGRSTRGSSCACSSPTPAISSNGWTMATSTWACCTT